MASICDTGSRSAPGQGTPGIVEGRHHAERWPAGRGRPLRLSCGIPLSQALIFEHTGRTPKTHHGVRTAFARLATTEPIVEPTLRRFLTQGYDLKSLADDAVGPDAVVSAAIAADAIDQATLFVARVQTALV